MSKEAGGASGKIDIPFSFNTNSTPQGNDNTFTLASVKAQGYVAYKHSCGLKWTLGQFDSVYGFDVNDSVGNVMITQGRMYSFLPFTHTGLLGTYTTGNFTVHLLASNLNGTGLRNRRNFEYGLVGRYETEQFYGQAGYLHYKDRFTDHSQMILDAILGAKFGSFVADAEVTITKAAAAGASTGVSTLLQLTYNVDSVYSLNVKGEYLSKSLTGNHSELVLMVGPNAKLNESFKLKLNYSLHSVKALSTTSTATTTHFGALSGIYSF